VRQARRGAEPVPAEAVAVCERAGADGITAHLREDRRHIQDADIHAIATAVTAVFNLEIACTAEMLGLAERLRPFQVTLVPERREEVTTEGGLALGPIAPTLRTALARLRDAGIRASLFIDPDRDSVTQSRDLGADAVELHTGSYAHAPGQGAALDALRDAAALGASLGLAVHAGHGLTTENVGPVAAIPEIEELNIGHHVISRAIFVGLDAAVRELRWAMDVARRPS
jgi:pyridoxine 5-phosphate synthase